jgi:hypothetical protein
MNLKECHSLWIGGIREERDVRMVQMLDRLGYKNTKISACAHEYIDGFVCKNGNTKSYIAALEIAANCDEPCIVFEDDANTTIWHRDIVDVPDDADALWIGTSCFGLVKGWRQMSICDDIFKIVPTLVGDFGDVYKVRNMLSAHAIVFISQRYKFEMINYLRYCFNEAIPPDIIFAETMKHFNIYACKEPLFFQDDKTHNSQPTTISLRQVFGL